MRRYAPPVNDAELAATYTAPWIHFQPALDAMHEPLGEAVLARVYPGAGERVLDVGCGCGTTTMAIAELVGPAGQVTGIDISADMIDVAGDAAAASGAVNVHLVEGDAVTYPFDPKAYDVVFSRLGTMFFDDPVAAFSNLRRALRPGGRLGFVCWRTLQENRWATEPRQAIAVVLPPKPPPPPGVPGPFSLGSADGIRSLLARTGFTDVEIEPHDEPLLIGRGDVDEAIAFFMHLLPTGHVLVESERHLVDRLRTALRIVVERHHGDDGIWMGSATWVVTAR